MPAQQMVLPSAVSTHAPTRGATVRCGTRSIRRPVSTHAPTRGATDCDFRPARVVRCFNPRAHAGRDPGRWPSWSVVVRFNPRAHAGRDLLSPSSLALCACFNPRAHAGRDGLGVTDSPASLGFNPRAHAGRDYLGALQSAMLNVSTHAPTRGATKHACSVRWHRSGFNPRAHAGRDCFFASGRIDEALFQPTRPRGARHPDTVGCG